MLILGLVVVGVSGRRNASRRLLWHPRPRSGETLDWSYAVSTESEQKPLLFVPGLGCSNEMRIETTVNNLAALRRQGSFDCLIGSFVEENALRLHDNESLAILQRECYVEYKVGAGFADFMQAVSPKLIHGKYSHVILLLDDVELGSFELDKALNASSRQDLGVATPRISNAILHPLLGISRSPQTSEIFHVDVVELFLTVFRADAWECMFDIQDPTRMLHGHGPARLMYKICKMRHPTFKMGVLNFMESIHFGAKEKCKPIEAYEDLRSWSGPQQRRAALRRFQPDEYVDQGTILTRIAYSY